MNNITLSKESLNFIMKHRNSTLNQSSIKPSVSFHLNDNDSAEDSSEDEAVPSPEITDNMKKAGRRSKMPARRTPHYPQKASHSFSKKSSSSKTSKSYETSQVNSTKTDSEDEDEDDEDEDIQVSSPLKPDQSKDIGRYVTKKNHTPNRLPASLNTEHQAVGRRVRSKSARPSTSKDNISSTKLIDERKPQGNKRQQKSGSSSTNKSYSSMKLISAQQSRDSIFQQSLSSPNETDELYTPPSNRTTLRENRSSSIVKTPNIQRSSRSANRKLSGVHQLENISANLSQRFSSLDRSTPERIIQLAHETSKNQPLSPKNTQVKRPRGSKKSQKDWSSPDCIPSSFQDDAIELETHPHLPSNRHHKSSVDLVIETVSRGLTTIVSPRALESLNSPAIAQTPVKKTPSSRLIHSLNIISSPRMSSLNVISERRAPSSHSSSDEFSPLGANLAPSNELQLITKKRKNSNSMDYASAKKMRTSAYSNERSVLPRENTDSDKDEVVEVSALPIKSAAKSVEQYTSSRITPDRFNPYLASIEDPFRARQLLLSEKFRVLWLELSPQCIFSMRIYSPSTVMVVAGSITLKSQQLERDITLDSSNQVAGLIVGALYHIYNTANVTATYQLTETLNS